MKCKIALLMIPFLLTGCNNYNGPKFHLEYVEEGSLVEVSAKSLFLDVKEGNDVVCYFGVDNCGACDAAKAELTTFLASAHYNIDYINLSNINYENEGDNSYSYLYEITKGDAYFAFPEDGNNITVPLLLMFKDEFVGLYFNDGFISMLNTYVTTD